MPHEPHLPLLMLDWAVLSERGGRRVNEDACGHWTDRQHLCCVLADGAGGHGGGDVAAQLTVRELTARFAAAPSADAAALGQLVRATNEALRARRDPGTAREDMHSTVVCLVLDVAAARAHWVWAGDSRLYRLRDGAVIERTRDHSLVQALVDSGAIDAAQARVHPRRSALRSALGLPGDQLELGATDPVLPLQPGDSFLLCSDGLWEPLDEDMLEQAWAATASPSEWLDRLATLVRERVRERPLHDNFSAFAVRVSAPAPAQ